jgi:hypothetical protein
MADVITHILTFIAGLAAGVVLKIRIDASRRTGAKISVAGDSQGKVVQSGNTVHGHMSGRDVNANN